AIVRMPQQQRLRTQTELRHRKCQCHRSQQRQIQRREPENLPRKGPPIHEGAFNIYPTPRIVSIQRGAFASSPSFFRSEEMCTSIERSKISKSRSATSSTRFS